MPICCCERSPRSAIVGSSASRSPKRSTPASPATLEFSIFGSVIVTSSETSIAILIFGSSLTLDSRIERSRVENLNENVRILVNRDWRIAPIRWPIWTCGSRTCCSWQSRRWSVWTLIWPETGWVTCETLR